MTNNGVVQHSDATRQDVTSLGDGSALLSYIIKIIPPRPPARRPSALIHRPPFSNLHQPAARPAGVTKATSPLGLCDP